MTRVASIVGLAAAALAAATSAAVAGPVGASAGARATIIDSAGVRVSWSLAMPSTRRVDAGAAFIGTAPSVALGMSMPANARLMLRRQDDTGQPVTAPTGFQVTTQRGDEALTIRTGADAEFSIAEEGSIASGVLKGASAASIEVGRGLILASYGGPDLPTPASALVVVVQYN
jgi:hypothetical protein